MGSVGTLSLFFPPLLTLLLSVSQAILTSGDLMRGPRGAYYEPFSSLSSSSEEVGAAVVNRNSHVKFHLPLESGDNDDSPLEPSEIAEMSEQARERKEAPGKKFRDVLTARIIDSSFEDDSEERKEDVFSKRKLTVTNPNSPRSPSKLRKESSSSSSESGGSSSSSSEESGKFSLGRRGGSKRRLKISSTTSSGPSPIYVGQAQQNNTLRMVIKTGEKQPEIEIERIEVHLKTEKDSVRAHAKTFHKGPELQHREGSVLLKPLHPNHTTIINGTKWQKVKISVKPIPKNRRRGNASAHYKGFSRPFRGEGNETLPPLANATDTANATQAIGEKQFRGVPLNSTQRANTSETMGKSSKKIPVRKLKKSLKPLKKLVKQYEAASRSSESFEADRIMAKLRKYERIKKFHRKRLQALWRRKDRKRRRQHKGSKQGSHRRLCKGPNCKAIKGAQNHTSEDGNATRPAALTVGSQTDGIVLGNVTFSVNGTSSGRGVSNVSTSFTAQVPTESDTGTPHFPQKTLPIPLTEPGSLVFNNHRGGTDNLRTSSDSGDPHPPKTAAESGTAGSPSAPLTKELSSLVQSEDNSAAVATTPPCSTEMPVPGGLGPRREYVWIPQSGGSSNKDGAQRQKAKMPSDLAVAKKFLKSKGFMSGRGLKGGARRPEEDTFQSSSAFSSTSTDSLAQQTSSSGAPLEPSASLTTVDTATGEATGLVEGLLQPSTNDSGSQKPEEQSSLGGSDDSGVEVLVLPSEIQLKPVELPETTSGIPTGNSTAKPIAQDQSSQTSTSVSPELINMFAKELAKALKAAIAEMRPPRKDNTGPSTTTSSSSDRFNASTPASSPPGAQRSQQIPAETLEKLSAAIRKLVKEVEKLRLASQASQKATPSSSSAGQLEPALSSSTPGPQRKTGAPAAPMATPETSRASQATASANDQVDKIVLRIKIPDGGTVEIRANSTSALYAEMGQIMEMFQPWIPNAVPETPPSAVAASQKALETPPGALTEPMRMTVAESSAVPKAITLLEPQATAIGKSPILLGTQPTAVGQPKDPVLDTRPNPFAQPVTNLKTQASAVRQSAVTLGTEPAAAGRSRVMHETPPTAFAHSRTMLQIGSYSIAQSEVTFGKPPTATAQSKVTLTNDATPRIASKVTLQTQPNSVTHSRVILETPPGSFSQSVAIPETQSASVQRSRVTPEIKANPMWNYKMRLETLPTAFLHSRMMPETQSTAVRRLNATLLQMQPTAVGSPFAHSRMAVNSQPTPLLHTKTRLEVLSTPRLRDRYTPETQVTPFLHRRMLLETQPTPVGRSKVTLLQIEPYPLARFRMAGETQSAAVARSQMILETQPVAIAQSRMTLGTSPAPIATAHSKVSLKIPANSVAQSTTMLEIHPSSMKMLKPPEAVNLISAPLLESRPPALAQSTKIPDLSQSSITRPGTAVEAEPTPVVRSTTVLETRPSAIASSTTMLTAPEMASRTSPNTLPEPQPAALGEPPKMPETAPSAIASSETVLQTQPPSMAQSTFTLRTPTTAVSNGTVMLETQTTAIISTSTRVLDTAGTKPQAIESKNSTEIYGGGPISPRKKPAVTNERPDVGLPSSKESFTGRNRGDSLTLSDTEKAHSLLAKTSQQGSRAGDESGAEHPEKTKRKKGTPAGRGVSLPAGRGVSVPGGRGVSVPGGRGVSVPGGKGVSFPGGRGVSVPGGRGVSVTGGRGVSLPGETEISLPGGRGFTLPGGKGFVKVYDPPKKRKKSSNARTGGTETSSDLAKARALLGGRKTRKKHRDLEKLMKAFGDPNDFYESLDQKLLQNYKRPPAQFRPLEPELASPKRGEPTDQQSLAKHRAASTAELEKNVESLVFNEGYKQPPAQFRPLEPELASPKRGDTTDQRSMAKDNADSMAELEKNVESLAYKEGYKQPPAQLRPLEPELASPKGGETTDQRSRAKGNADSMAELEKNVESLVYKEGYNSPFNTQNTLVPTSASGKELGASATSAGAAIPGVNRGRSASSAGVSIPNLSNGRSVSSIRKSVPSITESPASDATKAASHAMGGRFVIPFGRSTADTGNRTSADSRKQSPSDEDPIRSRGRSPSSRNRDQSSGSRTVSLGRTLPGTPGLGSSIKVLGTGLSLRGNNDTAQNSNDTAAAIRGLGSSVDRTDTASAIAGLGSPVERTSTPSPRVATERAPNLNYYYLPTGRGIASKGRSAANPPKKKTFTLHDVMIEALKKGKIKP